MADSKLEVYAKTDRNPIQEQEYQSLLTQSNIPFTLVNGRAAVDGFGAGGNDTNTSQFNYATNNIQQQQIYQKAIAPAVSSLEASRGEVNNAFDTRASQVEAQKDPLQARYAKLVEDIKGREEGQITDSTRVSSQEFGKRGIPLSSTAYQEENLRRIQPIQAAATSNIKDVTLDREEKLRGLEDLITNLTLEKVSSQRDISNTIAQIQASAGTEAAKAALQMFQIQQSAREAELDRAIQERLATVQENNSTASIAASKAPQTASVQGGLYDVTNNRWIVPPKPDAGPAPLTNLFGTGLGVDNQNKPVVSAKLAGDNSVSLRQDAVSNGGWEIVR